MPPKPGIMPSWSSGRPRDVPGVATRALQAIASSQPPPRASVWTAATVGLGPSSRRATNESLMRLSMPPPLPETN